IGCAGKVVSAFDIARMLALGADWCNAARGFMFALGCIQAQTCHTGACPTGVTTQDPQRQKALDVASKADRVHHFHQNTLLALKELVQAAGLHDPAEITASHIVRRNSEQGVKLLANLLPFIGRGELLRDELTHQVFRTYWPMASASSFAAVPAVANSPALPSVILSGALDLAHASR
ncbi:MAG: glutamate synthase-related protein, partial [Caldimonas sp.]